MKIIPLKIIALSFLVLSSFLCFSQDEKPKTIDEAVNYFIKNWSEETKKAFTDTSGGKSPVSIAHFGTGLWIRNNWIRGNRAPELVAQFSKSGLFDPDQISYVILSMVYKRLNNTPYNIDSILLSSKESHDKFMNTMNKMEDETIAHAKENLEKVHIGDSVRFYIPIALFTDGRPNEIGDNTVYYLKGFQRSGLPIIILDGLVIGKSDGRVRYGDATITIKITYSSRHDIRMHSTLDDSLDVDEIPARLIAVGNAETFVIQNIDIEKY